MKDRTLGEVIFIALSVAVAAVVIGFMTLYIGDTEKGVTHERAKYQNY